MKKSFVASLGVVVIVVVIASVFAATQMNNVPSINPTTTPTTSPSPTLEPVADKKPFYVGVTYCGNSTFEAQQLIDKVKTYTNLFVVQSGPLMNNLPALEEICDYATNANLSIMVYFSRNGDARNVYRDFLAEAQNRWSDRFLGVYFNDEPGGKMIDNGLVLYDNKTGGTIQSSPNGYLSQHIPRDSMGSSYSYDIQPSWANQPSGGNQIIITYSQNYPDNSYSYNYTTYYTNGTIVFSESSLLTGYHTSSRTIWYQPDGSICDSNDTAITDAPDRVLFGSYEQAYSKRPLQTQKEVADLFVSGEQNS
jgi:hypothetical protein